MKKRGKQFTQAEDDVIRLLNARGVTNIEIAKILGRGRMAVQKRIRRMKEDGRWGQTILDAGQVGRSDEQQ